MMFEILSLAGTEAQGTLILVFGLGGCSVRRLQAMNIFLGIDVGVECLACGCSCSG